MINLNTNLGAMIVFSNLKVSTNGLNTAIERMSTGFKIDSDRCIFCSGRECNDGVGYVIYSIFCS